MLLMTFVMRDFISLKMSDLTIKSGYLPEWKRL